jgi:hypothetical protein
LFLVRSPVLLERQIWFWKDFLSRRVQRHISGQVIFSLLSLSSLTVTYFSLPGYKRLLSDRGSGAKGKVNMYPVSFGHLDPNQYFISQRVIWVSQSLRKTLRSVGILIVVSRRRHRSSFSVAGGEDVFVSSSHSLSFSLSLVSLSPSPSPSPSPPLSLSFHSTLPFSLPYLYLPPPRTVISKRLEVDDDV